MYEPLGWQRYSTWKDWDGTQERFQELPPSMGKTLLRPTKIEREGLQCAYLSAMLWRAMIATNEYETVQLHTI